MNQARILSVAALLCLCVAISSCAYTSRFSPPVKHETNVVLKENDFEVVKRNLSGTYGYWNLTLFHLWEIPFGDPRIFSRALGDLYVGAQNDTENHAAQLVNWTLDQRAFIIPIPYFTPVKRTATFRADLIRYTK